MFISLILELPPKKREDKGRQQGFMGESLEDSRPRIWTENLSIKNLGGESKLSAKKFIYPPKLLAEFFLNQHNIRQILCRDIITLSVGRLLNSRLR